MTYLIFMDESGYAGKWEHELEKIRSGENIDQPYYFLSVILLPLEEYIQKSEQLRTQIGKLDLSLPKSDYPLGLGFELKGKNVIRIAERSPNPDLRSQAESILELILKFPQFAKGSVILVGIDKLKHANKYISPDDPYELALRYTLERVQLFLENNDDYGIVVYDLNHSFEQIVSNEATLLRREGSEILRYVEIGEYLLVRKFKLDINRILEFTFARSETSVGLIVADFFATFAYSYHKQKATPSSYSWDWEKWWDIIKSVMYKNTDGKIEGWGYKLFPE